MVFGIALFTLTVVLAACSGAGTQTPKAEAVVEDNWDFYIARVDDAPASIFLN